MYAFFFSRQRARALECGLAAGEECRASLAEYYRCVLPPSRGAVLDLCSSFTSHCPACDVGYLRVVVDWCRASDFSRAQTIRKIRRISEHSLIVSKSETRETRLSSESIRETRIASPVARDDRHYPSDWREPHAAFFSRVNHSRADIYRPSARVCGFSRVNVRSRRTRTDSSFDVENSSLSARARARGE